MEHALEILAALFVVIAIAGALEILAALFVVIAIAGFVIARALCIWRGPRERREMKSDHSKRRPF